MDPLIGAWLPNALFGVAGGYLFIMAVREKTLLAAVCPPQGAPVMKILDRYIVKEYLTLFIFILISIISIYLIIDFFSKIRMFMSNSSHRRPDGVPLFLHDPHDHLADDAGHRPAVHPDDLRHLFQEQ